MVAPTRARAQDARVYRQNPVGAKRQFLLHPAPSIRHDGCVSGVLAIVGRPNVGKSALFNRIAGRRIAIVHDQPGVTRDRITAEVEWRGRSLTVVDTGGIGLRRGEKATDIIMEAALEQVELAIEAAQAIIFVVNVQEGLVPLDEEVASRLRTAGKPVFLAVNKSDNERHASGSVDFSRLGFDQIFPVSAIHGRGVEALMNAAVASLPASQEQSEVPAAASAGEDGDESGEHSPRDSESPEGRPLRLAIVGRPNVGKSSLINAITESNRVVVSSIPGTTRDAVDVPFEVETEGRREQYLLVDTAGMRKRRRVDNSVEFFSVNRTEEAIGRSDVVILVLDAVEGIMEQDKKIGALITEARRACIIVVNKWDLVADKVQEAREEEIRRREAGERKSRDTEKRMTTLGEFGTWVQEKLFFLDYAPVIFTSAKSGFHLDRLLESVRYVAAQLKQSIPTAVLNRTLHDAVTRKQPVSQRGELLRFYYATQTGHAPPRFLLFVNRNDIFNRAYEKYLSQCLRTAFGYEGCPIVLIPKARPKTIESVRKPKPNAKKRSFSRRPPSSVVKKGARDRRPGAGSQRPRSPR
jgi:GTP-binding protein